MATVDLHPEIEPLRELLPIPDLSAETLEPMRNFEAPRPELSGTVERTDHVVDESTGVFVRVHRPMGVDGMLPCVYSIHGGGYVIGSVDMDDAKLDHWCNEFGIVGVSVEYRLAPEHPYPAPLDDCVAGLEWTVAHAADLGIDVDRIGITGVSAGGGLCAALALRLRDEAGPTVQFQLVDCPMIDDTMTTPSSQLDDLLIWSTASNDFGWRSYLGDLHGSDEVPATAAPARAVDLSGLPEAYISVGGADGFRDEDIEYARRLNQAGVPCELHVYPGVPHGIGIFVGTEPAARYAADQDDWLRRQLARLSG